MRLGGSTLGAHAERQAQRPLRQAAGAPVDSSVSWGHSRTMLAEVRRRLSGTETQRAKDLTEPLNRGCNQNPGSPCCLPGLRPEALRNDFGAALLSPSLLGGLEEFLEFLPNRASNSATRPTNAAISASRWVNATSRSASSISNCSNDGASGIGEHDGSTTKSTYLRGKSQYGQVQHPARQPKISEPRRKGPDQLPHRS